MRAVLSAMFAVLLTRFFYPGADLIYVVGLGVFLCGMAYVLDYFRNRKKGV